MKKISKPVAVLIAVIVLVAAGGIYYQQQASRAQLAKQAQHLLARGIALFEADQNAEALRLLESIPASASPDWRVTYYKGMAQIQLKDYQSAAANLEASLALGSGQVATLYALGVTYFKLGNLGLSKSYFAAVLEIDPGNEEARGLMDTMASLERFQEEQPAATEESGDG